MVRPCGRREDHRLAVRYGGILAVLMLLPLVLSGCADYSEVDDLLVVTGMAIDAGDRAPVKVTLDIVNPEQGTSQESRGPSDQRDTVVSAEAEDVERALDHIQQRLPHRLYLSHNAVVVLQQNVLRPHLTEILDFLERNRAMRRSQLWVMTTIPAGDIWRTSGPDQQARALQLRELVEQAADQCAVFRSDQLHLAKAWLTPSGTGLMTWVDPLDANTVQVRGLAGVTMDGRVHRFDLANDRGLLWWTGNTHTVLQEIPDGAIRWVQTGTRVDWVGTSQRPAFRVVWRGTGEVERWMGGRPLDEKAYRRAERLAQETVERDLRDAWREVVTSGMDVIGLQETVFRQAPQDYRKLAARPNWWKSATLTFDIRPSLIRSQLTSAAPPDVQNRLSKAWSGRG
ncbi:Ger(x)C family spore germination C-terminal domain-containing protein [Alicyclobacillus sp.]|uniref:Ger(x)C family spore germination protein n=1 Tax=Alicyclobacillus sp. TaxID=61169 RepID=UPI0025C2FE91|nr:Ger(x)C family spore germination C-terminal domain-containing protein [Alicyclobacillus sp.]MCL6516763.1 hypothetical protein [Alicyclobacillus sp.]